MTGVLPCFDSLIIEGKVVPYELIRRAHGLLVGAFRFIIQLEIRLWIGHTHLCHPSGGGLLARLVVP